ncbi:hypothetical protein B0T17DRAFT_544046 [Bombardia bombarda]|uniref:Uncharacterized protein n=1 Tax=Bombardia bombarda TaxID=252184 RepID=A0AA39TMD1_9PEZI|nr:hypothetical protein B0T17DRAFT_544046 [Bombardia bombarda]
MVREIEGVGLGLAVLVWCAPGIRSTFPLWDLRGLPLFGIWGVAICMTLPSGPFARSANHNASSALLGTRDQGNSALA